MTNEEVIHFQTFGFLLCKQLLSQEEMTVLSNGFDAAMERARGGGPKPQAGEKRQQIVPFFDYDPDVFYPLLDNEKILQVFERLLGEDFIFTLSSGIIHTSGTEWHHDACAPEGFFSMRAAIYLDALEDEDGCLNVIPGSQFKEYRDEIKANIDEFGKMSRDIPGRHPIVNEPGDVLFMNHKVFHASLSDNPGRRALHINCVQNTTAEKNQEHFAWLTEFLTGETNGWGRFYSEHMLETAGPRRKEMLDRAIALGYGNTGPISQSQDK